VSKFLFITLLVCCWMGVANAQSFDASKIKNPKVDYAAAPKLKRSPLPVVHFVAEHKISESDRKELLENVVYPVINKSEEAVSAIIIEVPEEKDKPFAGVSVYWASGKKVGSIIERDAKGRFDEDSYTFIFFDAGIMLDEPE
jgi:hypothetical protein